MQKSTEKNLFSLLCQNNLEEVKNRLFKDGKKKSFCPIRFFTDEQIEEMQKENNNKSEGE